MILYALTILVSAFLLFQVQPMIAKIILPWFGGSAAVWTTCMLFFQLALLLGYLYAHALIRFARPRVQMIVHIALLAVSALALPIYPRLAWKPVGTEEPTRAILVLLAVTVGLPYFLLSTTGPLLQAWYARTRHDAMPYRLYALSNAGSMFALLSYPVLFEPVFTTHQQTWIWSGAYIAFILLCGLTAIASGRMVVPQPTREASFEVSGGKSFAPSAAPTRRTYVLWLALPACASVLLLAITNHLSQNVAAIPFLWVLPLSIYLLTFILCFEGSGWYHRTAYLMLLAVALGSMTVALGADAGGEVKIFVMVPLFALGLYTCCMVCHGELARLKPDPRYLTHFYLMISAGGATGGLLVGLVAPHVFKALYEMQLGLMVCALVVLIALRIDSEKNWPQQLLRPALMTLAFVAMGTAGYVVYVYRFRLTEALRKPLSVISRKLVDSDNYEDYVTIAILALVTIALVLLFRGGRPRRRWAALGAEFVALVIAAELGHQVGSITSGYRVSVRNFYGALRVRDSGTPQEFDATRTLTHGTINHGEQFLNPARRLLPTTYYGPNTGVGVAIREKQKTGAIRVGVIGLGTGTIASYGRLGDYYRFYEINPLVLKLATSEFTFLPECKAKHDVAMGDARLSMERESPENFDVLAVDAFSSDSIPVHLLTREAMAVYFRHLRPDGILAVHISNRYLDLQPVLLTETKAMGAAARLVDTFDDETTGVFGATWVLIATKADDFDQAEFEASSELTSKRNVRLWTDDYSNLFRILK